MDVVADRSGLQAPGLCFVCETAPQERTVDTKQNFTPGFPSQLSGAKYICEGCVKAAAGVLGLVTDESARAAQFAQATAEAKLNAVLDAVKKFTSSVEGGALEDVAARATVVSEDVPAIEQVQGYEVAPQPRVDDQVAYEPNAITPVATVTEEISVPAAAVDEAQASQPKAKPKAKDDVQDA